MMTVPERIGVRLAKRRRELGLTQGELGARCGVSHVSISHYEAGRRQMAIETLLRLCAALEIDVAQVLTGIDVDPPAGTPGLRGRAAYCDCPDCVCPTRTRQTICEDCRARCGRSGRAA